MQYQSDSLPALSGATRFQSVRAGLRKLLFIVALTGAAYSRLNAEPRPDVASTNAHQHHLAISVHERLRSHI